MKNVFTTLGVVMFVLAHQASAEESVASKYTQKILLKNWALSRCLGQVYADDKTKEDANASAGAYLEFGRQPVAAYDALGPVIEQIRPQKICRIGAFRVQHDEVHRSFSQQGTGPIGKQAFSGQVRGAISAGAAGFRYRRCDPITQHCVQAKDSLVGSAVWPERARLIKFRPGVQAAL
jgi:hypothetical protein